MIDIITLTTQNAEKIAAALELEGIEVRIIHPLIRSNVPDKRYASVRVARADLPRAVKALELMMDKYRDELQTAQATTRQVLIPVDLTDKSMIGVRVGFGLAKRLNMRPVLLHSFVPPTIDNPLAITEPGITENYDMPTLAIIQEKECRARMDRFKQEVKNAQQQGIVAPLEFQTRLTPGLPEEVILAYAKTENVGLIVMSSRESEKRIADLVGSVTAEVLDSCPVPLFTVPANYDFQGISSIRKVSFFCNFDKNDFNAMDGFLSMFSYPEIDITLMPAVGKGDDKQTRQLTELRDRFARLFPSVHFKILELARENYKKRLLDIERSGELELIVAQNRKRNIFKRLLSPGIAHQVFYERDIPMLVWPL